MLIMDDYSIGISSINANVLANRANITSSEKNRKTKIDDEKRGTTWHLFSRATFYISLQFNTQSLKICA